MGDLSKKAVVDDLRARSKAFLFRRFVVFYGIGHIPKPALQCSVGKRERMHKRTGAARFSIRS